MYACVCLYLHKRVQKSVDSGKQECVSGLPFLTNRYPSVPTLPSSTNWYCAVPIFGLETVHCVV
jgi:hypothetical protein